MSYDNTEFRILNLLTALASARRIQRKSVAFLFLVQGSCDDIKREVLVHQPTNYQTAENLARLKVSVDRTIAENRKESSRDAEKEILYKLLDKLTPLSVFAAGPGKKMKN